ncbi:AAA family ATPase [Siphonobacter aquaeclarae]|uniref:MoxR-like ATPase n=1 Tax=Siphonobacter aquaeclarae TaxID=563176 RepID=A0A1G9NB97_9BACT|nr:MoxR family ATPase [Siphonobacter aquaeclarae]SDL83788.1 MoxR-like ATPase [Siphonobacter aquaeclarae]
MDAFESRIDLSELYQTVADIRAEVGKVIIGQQTMIDLLLTALFADGHVLIEGVPGVAKTLTAKLLAKTISVDFSRIQFTPDMMPSDVLGTSVYSPKTAEFEFKPGPVFSNIILIDEINRAPAKTQAALFEVMEERQVTNGGQTFPMRRPFLVLATQNPIEQEGTYRLPEAQLDRFLFKIVVGYPTLEQEAEILKGHHERRVTAENGISAVLSHEQLAALREKVSQILIEDKVLAYIAQIVHETRNSKFLYLGASPRASVALLSATKALAAIRGRDFVTPEDVQELAAPVLRHRLILTPEKEMEGTTPDDIVAQILKKVEVPR